MRISQVILRVTDLDVSVRFWTDVVGFDLVSRAGTFAFLEEGLTLNEALDVPADESLTEIVLEFDDIRSAHAEMADRGVPFEVDLRVVTGDGERELLAAHFRDPDGHLASVTGWVG